MSRQSGHGGNDQTIPNPTKPTMETKPMTHDQLLIKLSATKQSLKCLETCMAQAHEFPLKVVEQWWSEARAKVREIKRLEKVIADATP